MNYSIHITATAEHDIINASNYIDLILKNPQAADDLLEEVSNKINSLSDFPEKFQLVDDPVLSSWGIRFVVIKNYLAFYVISEESHQVVIVRFLYKKSNWNTILHQGFSLV